MCMTYPKLKCVPSPHQPPGAAGRSMRSSHCSSLRLMPLSSRSSRAAVALAPSFKFFPSSPQWMRSTMPPGAAILCDSETCLLLRWTNNRYSSPSWEKTYIPHDPTYFDFLFFPMAMSTPRLERCSHGLRCATEIYYINYSYQTLSPKKSLECNKYTQYTGAYNRLIFVYSKPL